MSTTPTETVDAYHAAWTSGDVDAALALIADEAVFAAPDPEVTSKAAWRVYLASFVPMLTGAPELTRMADGDRVALWYYPQTAVTQSTLASELFTVRDGRITEIRLAFDRMSYAPPAA